MAITVSFWTGNGYPVGGGSGLAWFGDAGFGASVSVGAYAGRVFVADGNGLSQGVEGTSVKYVNSQSGSLGVGGSGVNIKNIPNSASVINVRVDSDSLIRVEQARIYITDRNSINNGPSGVTCKVAEIIHPSSSQMVTGSGDDVFITAAGTGSYLTLANSPGSGGHQAGNGSTSTISSLRHDYFVAISPSPDSIGSKTMFGLVFSAEYY